MNMVSNLVRVEISNMVASDLDALAGLVQARRHQLDANVAAKFVVGQRVRFIGKRGRSVEGIIARFNRGGKFTVDNCTDGCIWRIPASLLFPV
jgi:hypothetical protein